MCPGIISLHGPRATGLGALGLGGGKLFGHSTCTLQHWARQRAQRTLIRQSRVADAERLKSTAGRETPNTLPTLPSGGVCGGGLCHHPTGSYLYAKGSHQERKLAMSAPQLSSNPAVPLRATAPRRGLTCARRSAGGAQRGRALLTGEVRERCDLFGADQDSAVEEAQELPGRLYLPAEARMLRRLGCGRRARGSRQEHGARRGGARARARGTRGVTGWRMASHGGVSWWPAAPRLPGTSRLRLPEPPLWRGPTPAPQQRGGGGELGRGKEPREGSA